LASEETPCAMGPLPATGIRVLAVDDKTVFDEEEEQADGEDDAPAPAAVRGARMLVTVMVSPDEARLLQAARERGELSLSLRNPLDASVESRPIAETPDDGDARHGTASLAQPLDGAQRSSDAAGWTTIVVRGSSAKTVEFDRDGRPVEEPAGVRGPPGPGAQAPPPPASGGSGDAGAGGAASDPPSRDDSVPLASIGGTNEGVRA